MNDEAYLSLAEAKKYVGRGFNANILKTSKNEFGASLGYRVSDLDAFIAKREVRNKSKLKYFGLRCTDSEFEEIENFTRLHGMGYRELVLRFIRKSNESPSFLKFLKED